MHAASILGVKSTMNRSADLLKERYIRQLLHLRDEKDNFLNAYFPDFGSRRTHVDKLLSSYTHTLDQVITRPEQEWQQIVLIGSSVTVTYLEDGMTDTYSIVFPDEAHPDHNRISFFSPIAEQLLMRAPGDLLEMQTNMGTLHIRIDAVLPSTEEAPEKGAMPNES